MKIFCVKLEDSQIVVKSENINDVYEYFCVNKGLEVREVFEVSPHKETIPRSKHENIDYQTPYYKYRLLCVDLETTGLSPKKGDKIIEVGISVLKDGKFVPYKNWLVNPGFQISDKITEITGITNEMLDGKPSFKDIEDEFMEALTCEPTIVFTYNLKFDKAFIDAEVSNTDKLPLFFCALKLARKSVDSSGYKLVDMINYFKLTDAVNNNHRATDDAVAAGEVFIKLAKKNRDFTHMSVADVMVYLK